MTLIETDRGAQRSWTRLAVGSGATAAAVDVAVMAALGEVIPPLAVGAVLTAVAIAVIRAHPGAAMGAIGVVSGLLFVTSLPFAVPELGHPASALGFAHAALSLGGRLVATIAVVAVWRAAGATSARRLGAIALGGVAMTALVAAVAAVTTEEDAARPGDVAITVRDMAFPPNVAVRTGGAVHVRNEDLVRHTFTVTGTALSRELPARTAVRFDVGLPPGSYALRCVVPGHETMKAELVVG